MGNSLRPFQPMYRSRCSLTRLDFNSGCRIHTIDIFARHGMGAARLTGGSINSVIQMFEGVEANIAIMGHDHKRCAVPSTPRLFLANDARDGLKVRQRETWAIRSGSYLASYRNGEVNYNVDSCRTPASLGHVEMRVKFSSSGPTLSGKRKAIVGYQIRFLT
jgi:hypothetical protein